MENTSVIAQTYALLDFSGSVNLATIESPPNSIYQSRLLAAIRQKLNVDSVFFHQLPGGETSIPHILFSHLESSNKQQLINDLATLHKTAWNMARAPLLFATTPDGTVRIYNTYIPPSDPQPNSNNYQSGLIETLNIFNKAEAARLRQKYHRREFESGRFWQNNSQRFNIKNRADQTLLQNLRIMYRTLANMLPDSVDSLTTSEIVHGLIGRSIFIKYLEDRRDSNDKNVFADDFFVQFVQGAACFTDVLLDKKGTYELFEFLKDKFNGDLFPVTDAEREYIQPHHLRELRLFLTGKTRMKDRQLRFWKFYAFDAIPIEFISNIYEEFFHKTEQERLEKTTVKTGTHYTPHHLVEFLVDEIFPWESQQVNYKVLDPACGSGIFLVEIYRRLIAHWQQANPSTPIQFKHLKKLLVDNIFGVDLDRGAIRVAAFSLYLTLCDFLEPRQIWNHVTFPPLHNKNLFRSDFFTEGNAFASSKYDLIIGNPPWQSSLTESCEKYIHDRKSDFPDRQFAPDNQIALTFLWRAAELCEPTGEICLFVPSKGLLFNRSQPHIDFRKDFFSSYHVSTVVNLSAYRHILFAKGVGAGAAIYYTPTVPQDQQPILYCSPKPTYSIEDRWQFTIDPYDIAELPRDEARQDNLIWKVAMWGGPRDYELINKLQSSVYQTLDELCENQEPKWIHGEGLQVGKPENQIRDATHLLDKPFLDLGQTELNRFCVNEKELPLFAKPNVQWPRTQKPEIFEGPHILVKQSPTAGEQSFRAALLKNATVFRDSLIGIHGSEHDLELLAQCCLALNSHIPLYYALMTSRKWLVERDELNKEEVMSFPLPSRIFDTPISYQELEALANDPVWEAKVQNKIGRLYNLTVDESILVHDAINYTLDYFRRGDSINPTYSEVLGERHLEDYLAVAQRMLTNSFSAPFQGVIYSGQAPVRVIGLSPTSPDKKSSIRVEASSQALENALFEVELYLQEQRSPGVFIQRHLRAYVSDTIYIIKPDQRRYWTQALALRDADEIYADVMAMRESTD